MAQVGALQGGFLAVTYHMVESINWLKLCEQAQHELDSAKLMALVAQINELMEVEEREQSVRLSNPPSGKD